MKQQRGEIVGHQYRRKTLCKTEIFSHLTLRIIDVLQARPGDCGKTT